MSKITSLKKPINSDAVLAFAEGALAAKTVTLRQEPARDPQVGFVIFVPVYTGGDVPLTLDDRLEDRLQLPQR